MNKIILFLVVGMVLLGGCSNLIKYGFSNCKYDGDCKIDEACAFHGGEFQYDVSKCEKLNCGIGDLKDSFLVICNEGKTLEGVKIGMGEEGEIHTCLLEEDMEKPFAKHENCIKINKS